MQMQDPWVQESETGQFCPPRIPFWMFSRRRRGKTGEIHHGSRQQCTVSSVLLIAAQLNSCRVKYHSALFTIQWRFSLFKQNKTFEYLTNKGKDHRSREHYVKFYSVLHLHCKFCMFFAYPKRWWWWCDRCLQCSINTWPAKWLCNSCECPS